MKRPRFLEFDCPACGNVEERFVETEDDGSPYEEQRCTRERVNLPTEGITFESATYTCNGVMVPCDIGMTLMAPLAGKDVKSNHEDAARQRERLEKRQDEHWKKKGRDEAIDTERALFKRHGMEGYGAK